MTIANFLDAFAYINFKTIHVHYLYNNYTSTLYDLTHQHKDKNLRRVDVSIFIDDLQWYDLSINTKDEETVDTILDTYDMSRINIPANSYYVGLRLNFITE